MPRWQGYCFVVLVRRATTRVAADIERYCATHPEACDSIDGLAWWVILQRFQDVRGEISAAVDQLVTRGVLQRHELQDGSVVFGCSKSKQK